MLNQITCQTYYMSADQLCAKNEINEGVKILDNSVQYFDINRGYDYSAGPEVEAF